MKAGDKVICNDGDFLPSLRKKGDPLPSKGGQYTIAEVIGSGLMVKLKEIESPTRHGFAADRFKVVTGDELNIQAATADALGDLF